MASRGRCPRPGAAEHCGVLATAAGRNGSDLTHALTLPTTRSRQECTQGLQTTAHPGHSNPEHPAPAAGDCPAGHNPQVHAARGTRAPPEQTPGAELSIASPEPAGHRLAAREEDRSQPRTAPSRAARSGDADTKGTRASPTWSRAVRAPARPRCARLAPPGAGSRVPLPPSASRAQSARPAAQRPFCLPALRPENCALGVGGARARTKRGLGRQNQFARRRPLPSRDTATTMHQDRAGSPLEQRQG